VGPRWHGRVETERIGPHERDLLFLLVALALVLLSIAVFAPSS
jgi:hypothetical protein